MIIRKKILMLTHEFPPFHGGIATYAKEMAFAAHLAGHEVTVLAPDYGEERQVADQKDYDFKVIRYRGGVFDSSLRSFLQVVYRTFRGVNRAQYDLIHAIDRVHIESLVFVNQFRNVPFIATVYGTDILAILSRKLRLLGIKDIFNRPKRILAISEFTKSLLIDRYPEVGQENVDVTLLGVNKFWFEQVQETTQIREQYGIAQDHRLILTVSRVDERKGHHLLLKALHDLSASLKKNVTYVIVGAETEPAYLAQLHQLASTCGVNVVFTGAIPQDDVRSFYQTAYLFCMPGQPHPHKVEGFGLVYLEAAAQGLPSIASRLGAIPEVVIDGKTGIVVEASNVNQLAEAIGRVLSDESLRKQLGQAAQLWAKTFTWSRCVEKSYDY